MRRSLALVLFLVALAGCAGAEKRGDRAAAVGDWKSAERQYAEALRKDPGNAQKQAKWQQARAEALKGAAAAHRACLAAQDWECAFAEADYVARLEPGDAQWATARADAARGVGLQRLRQAADAGARGDHAAAFDLFARGRDVSNDPAVQAEAARVAPGLVNAAVRDAERERAAQRYPAALELLGLASAVDGRVRPQLDAVRAEYDRWLEAQYEAEARQGDALLAASRFSEAQARYEAALRLRPGGRAEPLARYARALATGQQAVARRDWPAATAAYDQAIRTGQDTSGFAAVELERVRVRPYAVRVRTVLVKPFRPDGAPWAGGRNRGFERTIGLLASAALDRSGAGVRGALDVYDMLPHENRPSLVASLVLPDGREYVTPAQRALRARLESIVVLDTNAYDDRPVSVRLFHDDPSGRVEIGAVTFRMMDAVAGELALADRSIVELRVAAEASPLRDGQTQGFVAVPPPPRPAPAPAPAPAPR